MKSSLLNILNAVAILAVTQIAQATSPDYVVTTSSGASIIPGTDDIGLYDDDGTQNIALPFSVMFYDQVFNSVNVSTNGNLQFTTTSNSTIACLATSTVNNVIAPFWADQFTRDAANGQGIFTSVSGVSPNRIFNIEWRTQYCCSNGVPNVNFEVRLYENQRRIDFIYGDIIAGSHAVSIGVQRDTGSQSTVVSCGNSIPVSGTMYTFTIPNTCIAPPPNMVAWWRGDGNADDSIGGHNGSLMAGATFAAGEVGQGFSFNGSGARVSVPSPIGNFGTSDFTIDFWMQTSATNNREIINKRLCGDTSSNGFEVRLNGGSLLVELLRDNDPTGSNVTSGRTYNDGQFHHIAIVRSGNTLSIYGDGTLDNSTTDPNVGSTDITNTLPLGIGGGGCSDSPPAGDGTATFAGILDEVEIFNRALTVPEISDIYSAGSGGNCHCTTPPANILSWWPGEGDDTDIQGGNTVTVSGSGVGFGPGEVDQAFSFTGNGYLTAGDPNNLRLTGTEVTLDAWVNPTNAGESGVIAGKTADSANDYLLYLSGGTVVGLIKSGGSEITIAGGVPPAGTWTHVALVYDGITNGGTVKTYYNGILFNTTSKSGNLDGDNSEVAIGGRAAGDLNFVGFIDEVEVFNRALSGDDIAKIYHAGSAGKCRSCTSAPNGMLDWWPGDGNANDIQGGNKGTLQGDATFAPGKVKQAFSFDGNGDYVDVGNVDVAQTFTIDAWIYPQTTAGAPRILSRSDLGPDGYEFRINPAGVLDAIVYTGNGDTFVFYQTGNPVVTLGTWQHVAMTYDGNAGAGAKIAFYVNGVSVPVSASSDDGGTTFLNPAITAKIGICGNGSTGPFLGLIDEVELFNRVLDPSEVAAIYDAGSGGKCKPAIPATRQLANISTRASVGTGDNVAIGGFVIHDDPVNPNRSHTNGTPVLTKQVIIRGLGPSLQVNSVPVPGRLADPVLELHDGNGAVLETNDNWGDAANASDIQASGFAPSDPNESAILVTLNSHSAYTAILSGAGNTSGIGIVEVFDLEKTSNTHLANISTRGFVSTGDDVLIGGLIVQGDTSARVIVRAMGPTLTGYGVSGALQDPALELHDVNGALIASNDDWPDSPDFNAINNSGFAPGNPKESAILFVPAPGNYTAIVSGVGNTTGIGLVEAFRLQN